MTFRANSVDVAIIGGGILGLWSAYTILKKFPDLLVVVFEAENFLGEHTSGRNSEVLHSGLYYPTNSLKHNCCLEGNQLWREYILKNNLAFLNCGKMIIATPTQEEKLENLFLQGQLNELKGLRKLDKSELILLGDKLHISNGFFIPSAGVLSVSESIKSLKYDIEIMGGVVLTRNKVRVTEHSFEKFILDVNDEEVGAKILVNSAGLFAVPFRQSLGLTDYENFFVKGSYLKLRKKLELDKLIYPIPPIDGLGLGVHLTLDTSLEQKFGPNTEEVSTIDYSIADTLIEKMFPAINEIFKNINKGDLQLGYAGIRPKVKKNGQLISDFKLNTHKEHGIKGYFELLGIESPGITAAPSLAKKLCDAL